MSNFPTPAASWSDIARLCRRVCLLRERGEIEEAERLRAGELMVRLAEVRGPDDTDASVMERLNALFAVEAERVANAAVLAELLVPLLAEQLRPTLPATAPPSAPPPAVTVDAARPPPPRRDSIADFIDDMIAQQRPPQRTGAERRAS